MGSKESKEMIRMQGVQFRPAPRAGKRIGPCREVDLAVLEQLEEPESHSGRGGIFVRDSDLEIPEKDLVGAVVQNIRHNGSRSR